MRIGVRAGWKLLIAAIASLAPVVIARGQQREPLVGRVLDRAGEPVEAAEVSLAYCRSRAPVGEGGSDECLRAVTDARGRFRVSILPSRSYSIDARWRDAAGRDHVSEIREGGVVGEFLELRESARSPWPPGWRVRVVGLEAWERHGPFGYRVLTAGRARRVVEVEAVEGSSELLLPPLPDGRGTFQVLDRNGGPLLAAALSVDPGNGEVEVVRIDPPEVRELLVVSAEGGEAIAGARVWHRSVRERSPLVPLRWDARVDQDWWREVGRTDAEGRIRCEVAPDPIVPRTEQVFLVEADGYAATVAGWRQADPFVAWGHAREPRRFGEALEVPLGPAVRVYGKLTIDGVRPVAGVEVVVSPLVSVDDREFRWWLPDRAVVTDERGWFRIDGLPSHRTRQLVRAFVPADAWRSAADREGPFPESVLPFGHAPRLPEHIGSSAEFGVARLDSLRRIRVRVLDAEGLPVRGALVEGLVDRQELRGRRALAVRTDGRGLAMLPSVAGAHILVGAQHPQRGLGLVLHEDLEVDELEIGLDWGIELRARVLDGEREPDPDAGVEVAELRVGLTAFETARALAGVPQPASERLPALRGALHVGLSAACDADGRFALRVYPGLEDRLVLRFHGTSGHAPLELDLDRSSIEGDVLDLGDLALPWR